MRVSTSHDILEIRPSNPMPGEDTYIYQIFGDKKLGGGIRLRTHRKSNFGGNLKAHSVKIAGPARYECDG